MDERTAEVLAEEQVSLLNSNLATKFQLAEVDLRLSKQIAEVNLRLSRQIAEVIYVLPKLKPAYLPAFQR